MATRGVKYFPSDTCRDVYFAISNKNYEAITNIFKRNRNDSLIPLERAMIIKFAAQSLDVKLLELFLFLGLDLRGTSGLLELPPLHIAAYNLDCKMCKLLVRCGASVTEKDFYGMMPIEYARSRLCLLADKGKRRKNIHNSQV